MSAISPQPRHDGGTFLTGTTLNAAVVAVIPRPTPPIFRLGSSVFNQCLVASLAHWFTLTAGILQLVQQFMISSSSGTPAWTVSACGCVTLDRGQPVHHPLHQPPKSLNALGCPGVLTFTIGSAVGPTHQLSPHRVPRRAARPYHQPQTTSPFLLIVASHLVCLPVCVASQQQPTRTWSPQSSSPRDGRRA